MSKFVKLFAIVALLAGAIIMAPGSAQARGGHHHHHGGGWGWGGWGPAWGYPYPYYSRPYYYAGPPGCGWVRVWRHGRWVLRRSARCYYY